MGGVKDSIKALTFPGGGRRWPLDTPAAKPGISAGKGSSKSALSSLKARASVYDEQCVIYSEVLVQEAGVFELPTGWPDTNTYDGFTFAASVLPVIGDPYVLQRRTHAYAYTTDSAEYLSHHLLLEYAAPFVYTPHNTLIFPVPGGRFVPVMHSVISPEVILSPGPGDEPDLRLNALVEALYTRYGIPA